MDAFGKFMNLNDKTFCKVFEKAAAWKVEVERRYCLYRIFLYCALDGATHTIGLQIHDSGRKWHSFCLFDGGTWAKKSEVFAWSDAIVEEDMKHGTGSKVVKFWGGGS